MLLLARLLLELLLLLLLLLKMLSKKMVLLLLLLLVLLHLHQTLKTLHASLSLKIAIIPHHAQRWVLVYFRGRK